MSARRAATKLLAEELLAEPSVPQACFLLERCAQYAAGVLLQEAWQGIRALQVLLCRGLDAC